MVGNIRPDDLTAQILKALLERNPDLPLENIEDVLLGCGYPEGSQGMLLARSAAVLAGIPIEAGAKVVNRLCGSSMDAVHQISRAVEIGDLEVGIAAGVEDMFSIPRGGFNPVYNSELEKQNYYIDMGLTAENLAAELNISREDQETFSIVSHEKALTAQDDGRFHNEIVPVKLEDGTTVEADEGPRSPDLEKIHSLKPAFSEKGTVTAATSSPFSIGAGAAIVTSRQFAKKHSLNIRAEIVSRAVVGGGVGLSGHLTICDGVQVTGMSLVTNSIHEPGVYSSGTGAMSNTQWRKNAVRFKQLDELAKRVTRLEKK